MSDELPRLRALLSVRPDPAAIGDVEFRTSESIRAALARHPNTPDALLTRLAVDGSPLVRALAQFESTRRTGGVIDAAERAGWEAMFWTTCGAWVAEQAYVFDRLSTFATQLASTARNGGLLEYVEAPVAKALVEAEDSNTPDDRLALLATHPVPFVTALVVGRRTLAETTEVAITMAPVLALSCAWQLAQRATSPLALARLAETSEQNLRSYIARNRHTALPTLEKLSYERWADTLASIARHPNADESLLLRLARDRLSDTVLEAVASNPRASTEALAIVARYGSKESLTRVAEHANIDPFIARTLAETKAVLPRTYVARNRATPLEVVLSLAAQRREVFRAETRGNDGDYDELLGGIADSHAEASVLRAVIDNPDCREDVRAFAVGKLAAGAHANEP